MLYNVMEYIHEKGFEIPLVITAKEAPEYKIKSDDFKKYAEKIGAKFYHTAKINSLLPELQEMEKIDISISINYSSVISDDIINLFKIGVLNMHAGDLPRYRGNAVVAWAMLNKEKSIVNCIHKMIGNELDSGDIILKNEFELTNRTKIGEVFEWLETSAPIIFLEALEKLRANPEYVLEQQSKDPTKALRCYPRKPEDNRIHWNDTAGNIDLLIRACSFPFSGAFAYFNDEMITILDAEVFNDHENFIGIPGQIAQFDNEHAIVLTGSGKLKITSVLYQGKKTTMRSISKSLRDRLK